MKPREEQNIESRAERAITPKQVRVLMVAPSMRILGGQAVQAARLLARLGEEPSLEVSFLPINPRLPGALARLQDIKYVRTIITSALYVASLLWRAPRYDVLHVFSASYFSFLLAPTPAILAAKLYSKKSLLNYRSGECEDHLTRWRRTTLPVLRAVDMIVTPSNYLVDVFARFGLEARAVHNIVESDRFRFRPRPRLRPVFLSNRNLEPLYNVGCTLRAFARIQAHCPEASLVIAGDGSERAALERLARELNLRGVEFLGRVAPEEMPALYAKADIYLNSPNIDNMPNSILEAYASGLAVVTTDAGGIPYIVRHEETGLMVARDDAEALATCALRLLEDDALAQRIISNARDECRKYTWAATREAWLNLYHEIAHERANQSVEYAREETTRTGAKQPEAVSER